MTILRTQFDTPKNKEKLAKVAIVAIGVLATIVTLDIAGELGSYLGSVSMLLTVSFLFALLSAISTQSHATKFNVNAFASTNTVSDIRDRLVTKTAEPAQAIVTDEKIDSVNLDKVA